MKYILLPQVLFLIGICPLISFASISHPSSMDKAPKLELSEVGINYEQGSIKSLAKDRLHKIQNLTDSEYQSLKLIAFSDDEPMGVRWKALIAMAQSRHKNSRQDILLASNSKQWYMRNAALVALEDVDYPDAVELAKKLLKDKALVVRSAAIEVLAPSADGEIRKLLWEELEQTYNFRNKQSLWIRGQIVEVLVDRAELEELEQFTKLLQDKDLRVSYYSTFALEKLKGPLPTVAGSLALPKPITPKEKVKLWIAQTKKSYIEI